MRKEKQNECYVVAVVVLYTKEKRKKERGMLLMNKYINEDLIMKDHEESPMLSLSDEQARNYHPS